jgi:hypothetical protein
MFNSLMFEHCMESDGKALNWRKWNGTAQFDRSSSEDQDVLLYGRSANGKQGINVSSLLG